MKKVEIVNEKMTLGQLKKGLVVSGRLVLKETKDGRLALYFIPYNRQPRIRRKEVLIHTLEFGRVTESSASSYTKVYRNISDWHASRASWTARREKPRRHCLIRN